MPKHSIKIVSEVPEIRKTSSKIIDFLKSYNLDEGIIFDIRLCTEEALRNAMKHGNKGKKDKPVLVSYSFDKEKLEITIEDSGSGFEYKKIPDPTTEENILKASGRGVYLIQKLMDEVHFNDRGNRICMVKYISGKRG